MKKFIQTLDGSGFGGKIDESASAKDFYSHDASMFELRPEVVVFPKNTKDVEKLVKAVNETKTINGERLSLTVRSAGTDMSGGAIGESVVLSMTENFNKIVHVDSDSAHVQPGVYYRDFEKQTLKHNALLPSFPASRELCTVGGMVANNSGGEKSLEFGKTDRFVEELEVVFADGNAYTVKPLEGKELKSKLAAKSYEGQLYKQIFDLCEKNYDVIQAAKPKVAKDSTGYHLWDVWDRETGVFDLTKLIVGSQGTLGIVTDIKFRLVQTHPYNGVLVAFLKSTDELGDIINTVMAYKPATFEAFDNYTLMLAIKFFLYFGKTLGWFGLIKLAFQLLPDALILFSGVPKFIMLIEFTGETQEEVDEKITEMKYGLAPFELQAVEENNTESKAWKYRIMRRESFNLLRKKVKDKHTAPFIDDLVVPPARLSEFLPKLRKTVNKYKLLATIAGHMGEGNFHVIPLMKLEDPKEREKLLPAMREVNELVLHYGGSLSGEHNDGLVRGPWLEEQYGKEVVALFRQAKQIMDPDNIFNPKKKTDATWDFSFSHIRASY